MPENDIVDDQWAHDARRAVELVVEQWNAMSTRVSRLSAPLELVWGHGDTASAEIASELMTDLQQDFGEDLPEGVTCPFQSGCLFSSEGIKIELSVNWDVGNSKVQFKCEFGQTFILFPSDGRELYNALQICRIHSVNPLLLRGDGRDIEIYGVVAEVRTSLLNSAILDDALHRLVSGFALLFRYLDSGDGPDFWDGRASFDDESEDDIDDESDVDSDDD